MAAEHQMKPPVVLSNSMEKKLHRAARDYSMIGTVTGLPPSIRFLQKLERESVRKQRLSTLVEMMQFVGRLGRAPNPGSVSNEVWGKTPAAGSTGSSGGFVVTSCRAR